MSSGPPLRAPGASCSSARPTKTPAIRRRYQSVAMASVNGSHSVGRGGRRGGDRVRVEAASRPGAVPPRRARIGCGPTAPSAMRASATRSPSHSRRAATVTTAGVLACLRPNLRYAVGPPGIGTLELDEQLVVGQPVGQEPRVEVGQRQVALAVGGWPASRVASSASRATATSPPGRRREQVAADGRHVADRPAGRVPGGLAQHRDVGPARPAGSASSSPRSAACRRLRSSPSRPARRRPMTVSGSEIPSLISGIATVPPAITSRSGPCLPSRSSASGSDRGQEVASTVTPGPPSVRPRGRRVWPTAAAAADRRSRASRLPRPWPMSDPARPSTNRLSSLRQRPADDGLAVVLDRRPRRRPPRSAGTTPRP